MEPTLPYPLHNGVLVFKGSLLVKNNGTACISESKTCIFNSVEICQGGKWAVESWNIRNVTFISINKKEINCEDC